MPVLPLLSVLETALYVLHLDRSVAFHESVMALPPLYADHRMRAYSVNEVSVLLLFLRGATTQLVQAGGGLIPPHDAIGQIHLAFAIAPESLENWRDHLTFRAMLIEVTSDWQRGGHSLYFRDPDANMLVVATTPGLWRGF